MKSNINKNTKKYIFLPFGIAALLALISYVVMLLWNNLLPEILHVGPITFWQSMGIFILCKILFGFGKGGGGTVWSKQKLMERWQGMSLEERQRFKQKMTDRMCLWSEKDPDSTI